MGVPDASTIQPWITILNSLTVTGILGAIILAILHGTVVAGREYLNAQQQIVQLQAELRECQQRLNQQSKRRGANGPEEQSTSPTTPDA